MVLEEGPETTERVESEYQRPNHLLVLSAKGEKALDAQVNQYIKYLDNTEATIGDICYTAGIGRAHFDDRIAISGQSIEEIKAKLKAKDFIQNKLSNQNTPKIAWLFTGQGSQRIKLGLKLYETHPVFKEAIDHCSDHLKRIHEYDFKVIWQSDDEALITQTQHAQVLLFVIEYALARLWQSFGIYPDYVAGHSVGEIVAAVIAGVMSVEDGLTLIYHRGRLMQSLPAGGGMLVVMASLKQAKALIKDQKLKLSIAAINGPTQIVVSGDNKQIENLEAQLKSKKIRSIRLNVSHAFHSNLMQPMVDEFKQVISGIEFKAPQIKMLSNVTGDFIKDADITGDYWVDHILSGVNFAGCVKSIEKSGCTIYHEIGPDGTLIAVASQSIKDTKAQLIASLAPNKSGWESLLTALGHLYTQGVDIDWAGYDKPYNRQKVLLPTYPFQRRRYWIEQSDVKKNLGLVTRSKGNKVLLSGLKALDSDVVYEASVSNLLQGSVNELVFDDKKHQQFLTEGIETRRSQIEGLLAEALLLEPKDLSDLDCDKPLLDHGIDSIVGIEFVNALNKHFQIKIAVAKLYDYSTVNQLTDYVGECLQELDDEVHGRIVESKQEARPIVLPTSYGDEIAIIGMSGRFPGSDTLEEYWQNIANQVDCISKVPVGRWHNINGDFAYDHGGFLSSIDQFDPHFFGLSEKEAESMDPQQRLLLEEAWICLEQSGYSPSHLSGKRCGVFVGVAAGDYSHNLDEVDILHYMGNATDAFAGRLSYLLNLTGPSMAINTGCSSSLVALANGCDSLVLGHSDIALAGGVRVFSTEMTHQMMGEAEMLSTQGHCYSFDQRADGTIPSEGVGVVLLKRLQDAKRDGDQILAVLKGWGVNQDGKTNGLTVPSGDSQTKLITEIYQKYGIDVERISLVEAQGAGTRLGDAIELMALDQVFKHFTDKTSYCAVGTVQSNIGHALESGAMAGLMKLILSIKHQQIPPTINYEELNEEIKIEDSSLYINDELIPWATNPDQLRLCAVSSFGLSGTNAHVVLEEAPEVLEKVESEYQRPNHLLVLSAKGEKALDAQLEQYINYLRGSKEEIGDICYTAGTGRAHFDDRLAVVGQTVDEIRQKLEAKDFIQNRIGNQSSPKVAWLFAGFGSQRIKQGHELYETHPVFKQAIDHCSDHLKIIHDYDFKAMWQSDDHELIAQTKHTQVSLFVVEYGLAKLWQSFGVHPNFICGHGVGEIIAAVIAGVMSVEDGLTLIYHRGCLMQSLPSGGGMLVVMASLKQVKNLIKDQKLKLSIAGINGPKQIMVSGGVKQIEKLEAQLKAKKIHSIRLNVSHAFHSDLMRPMVDEFKEAISGIEFKTPQIKMLSNVTGDFIKDNEITADYWVDHILSAVNFAGCVKTIEKSGCTIYQEIGPDGTLIGLVSLSIKDEKAQLIASLSPSDSNWKSMLTALGHLYVQGVVIDWAKHDQPYNRQKVSLPTYPFQRQRYWTTATKQKKQLEQLINHEKLKTLGKAEAIQLIGEKLVEELSRVLRIQDYRLIDQNKNLFDLGMDSLMTINFVNFIRIKLIN